MSAVEDWGLAAAVIMAPSVVILVVALIRGYSIAVWKPTKGVKFRLPGADEEEGE